MIVSGLFNLSSDPVLSMNTLFSHHEKACNLIFRCN